MICARSLFAMSIAHFGCCGSTALALCSLEFAALSFMRANVIAFSCDVMGGGWLDGISNFGTHPVSAAVGIEVGGSLAWVSSCLLFCCCFISGRLLSSSLFWGSLSLWLLPQRLPSPWLPFQRYPFQVQPFQQQLPSQQ